MSFERMVLACLVPRLERSSHLLFFVFYCLLIYFENAVPSCARVEIV
jgi:hypothetical protein